MLAKIIQEVVRRVPQPGRRPPTLHHVTVEVAPTQIQACVTFYISVLGLTPTKSRIRNSVWFEEGVHLYWGMREQPHAGPVSAQHLALVVGDRYEAIVERCKRKNLFIVDGSVYWGSSRCYVADPEGNRIELMVFAP